MNACGGGGGNGNSNGDGLPSEDTTTGDTNTGDAEAAVDGIVYGPIDGFGSILVSGVEFSTQQANFFRDGANASESDFEAGDMVTICGSLNPDGTTGTATSVSYQANVFGPITRTWKDNSMEVLGQIVTANSFTAQKGIDVLEDLPLGTLMEITGIVDGNGTILASRMISHGQASGAPVQYNVSGVLKSLNSSAQTFAIGNLSVDYSGANLLDVPGDGLANGLAVRVSTKQSLSGNVLKAETVQAFGGFINGKENDKVEIVGFVNGLDNAGNFSVGTQPVQMLNTTKLTNGTSGDIFDGAQAEVEGHLDNYSVLIAEEVVIRPPSVIYITADVTGTNLGSNTITVLGTTAVVNNLTRRVDKTNVENKTFGLADIIIGNGMEIIGFIGDSGAFIATKIKRLAPISEVIIRGPVESADAAGNTVTVLGTTIFLQSDTVYQDFDNNPITKEEFFAALEPGITIVKSEGTPTGTAMFTATGIRVK